MIIFGWTFSFQLVKRVCVVQGRLSFSHAVGDHRALPPPASGWLGFLWTYKNSFSMTVWNEVRKTRGPVKRTAERALSLIWRFSKFWEWQKSGKTCGDAWRKNSSAVCLIKPHKSWKFVLFNSFRTQSWLSFYRSVDFISDAKLGCGRIC